MKAIEAMREWVQHFSFKDEYMHLEYVYYMTQKNPPSRISLVVEMCWIMVVQIYYCIKQQYCTHPHMVDEGYAGPDSGSIDLYCPDCHASYHHQLY